MQIRGGYAAAMFAATFAATFAAMFAATPAATFAAAQALVSLVHGPPLTAPSTIDHVVVISVDGLRPELLLPPRLASLPSFARLLQGPHTLDARTDAQITITLPNHVSMVTGRPMFGPYGHNWTYNDTVLAANVAITLHTNKGAYITSMFDVAHDAGISTSIAVTKTKFWLFEQSYGWSAGAPDTTSPDNGQAKIDLVLFAEHTDDIAGTIADRLRRQTKRSLDFVHLAAPDVAGHSYDWNIEAGSRYCASVAEVDHGLGLILEAIDGDAELRGHTAIILTADHGGGMPRKTHTDLSCPINFHIPFVVWLGDGVAQSDLLDLNPDRARLGRDEIGERDAQSQPIRNGDAANLALELLGLPPIPGSFYGFKSPLRLAPLPATTRN